jgi:hypothetical protein
MVIQTAIDAGVDPLVRFAEIERLAGRVYFRFSHLFLDIPELRDFWWQMAVEEEQHACVLIAIRTVIETYREAAADPAISHEKADQLEARLLAYLGKGTPMITVDESLSIALDIESSEIDAIYSKLLQLGGSRLANVMVQFGVPVSAQIRKLKSMVSRFSEDPELRARAESL